MTIQDLKLTILNSIVLVLTTFTNIEGFFKILLLVVSIIYTSFKTYELYINKIKNRNGSDIDRKDKDTSSED